MPETVRLPAAQPALAPRKPAFTALAAGALVSRDLAAGEMLTAHVSRGAAWVTLEGDAEDYVLRANDSVRLSGPGRVVAEAMEGEAVITFTAEA